MDERPGPRCSRISGRPIPGGQPRPGAQLLQGVGLLAETVTAACIHSREGDEASVVEGAAGAYRLQSKRSAR